MKSKKFTILLASLLIITNLAIATPITYASEQNGDDITITVDEDFFGLNFLNMTQNSTSADWVFTMIGDRLLKLDSEGNFLPDIATDVNLRSISLDDDIEDGADSDEAPTTSTIIGNGSLIGTELALFPDWPEEWGQTPPGWKSNLSFDWYSPELNYFTDNGILYLDIRLRDDITYHDGEPLNAYTIKNLIDLAKQLPADTLLYKQWSPVTNAIVIDEMTLQLFLRFYDQPLGCYDFLYSLTSPIASMFYLDEEMLEPDYNFVTPLATGAYFATSVNPNSVTLESYENWWNGTVPTDNITFIYEPETIMGLNSLKSGNSDIAIVNEIDYDNYDGDGNLTLNCVSGNPLAITFNLDTNTVLNDPALRLIISCIINKEDFRNAFYLASSSNDYWTLDDRYYYYYIEEINEFLAELGYYNLSLNLLCEPNSIMAQYIANILYNCGITVNYPVTQAEYDFMQISGYDFALEEIDLSNLNSAYNTLYAKIGTNGNGLIEQAKIAADIPTYMYSQLAVQIENYNQIGLIILGWETKIIGQTSNISGISIPNVFNPRGDMCNIDFRYVVKNS